MEVVQLLGFQGFWQHQVLKGADSEGSRKYSALEGMATHYSCLENPLTEKPGRPQSTGLQTVGHSRVNPMCTDERLFSPWQLHPSEGSA